MRNEIEVVVRQEFVRVDDDAGAQTSEQLEFSMFYREEIDRQVRRAYLMVLSNELANDIVHEAMVQVLRRWDALDNPAAYLNRSVLNGCRDHARRRVTGARLLSRVVERDGDPGTRDVLVRKPVTG